MGSKRMLTRGHFLRISASLLGMGSLPLGLGCSPEAMSASDDEPGVDISHNHGHVLAIPLAIVMAGRDVTYEIQGNASHSHRVTLTTPQLERLRRGETVVVSSTATEAHDHRITISG